MKTIKVKVYGYNTLGDKGKYEGIPECIEFIHQLYSPCEIWGDAGSSYEVYDFNAHSLYYIMYGNNIMFTPEVHADLINYTLVIKELSDGSIYYEFMDDEEYEKFINSFKEEEE